MISCTEFIPAYNELFKFIEKNAGKQAVVNYWKTISGGALDKLDKEVSANGLEGCYNYWAYALNEEAADFTITLDSEKEIFVLDMHYCPSKGRLIETEHIEPYHDYCGHCPVLYKTLIESYGLKYEYDMSECDKAKCKIVVTKA